MQTAGGSKMFTKTLESSHLQLNIGVALKEI